MLFNPAKYLLKTPGIKFVSCVRHHSSLKTITLPATLFSILTEIALLGGNNDQSRRAISAKVAFSSFARSAAASSISSPRLPPET